MTVLVRFHCICNADNECDDQGEGAHDRGNNRKTVQSGPLGEKQDGCRRNENATMNV